MSGFSYAGTIELSASNTAANRGLIHQIVQKAQARYDGLESYHTDVINDIFSLTITYEGESEYGYGFADTWLDALCSLCADTKGVVTLNASLEYWGSQDGRIHADNTGVYDDTLTELADNYEMACATAERILEEVKSKRKAGTMTEEAYAAVCDALNRCFDLETA